MPCNLHEEIEKLEKFSPGLDDQPFTAALLPKLLTAMREESPEEVIHRTVTGVQDGPQGA